jgi:hypothetical protein
MSLPWDKVGVENVDLIHHNVYELNPVGQIEGSSSDE